LNFQPEQAEQVALELVLDSIDPASVGLASVDLASVDPALVNLALVDPAAWSSQLQFARRQCEGE